MAPANVRVLAKTNNSLTVGWDASPATDRVLRYQINIVSSSSTIDVPGNNTFFALTGLQRNVLVQFRIRALNPTGAGAWSSLIEQITDYGTSCLKK